MLDPTRIRFKSDSGHVSGNAIGETRSRRASFAGDFTLSLTEYEDRNLSILDVMHPGVTKGFALAEWSRRRGIPREK